MSNTKSVSRPDQTIAAQAHAKDVALPNVTAGIQRVVSTLADPEAWLSEVTKSGQFATVAKAHAGAYVGLGKIEAGAKDRRTFVGAQVHRVMTLGGSKPADIADALAVTSGRVSQLKVTARLIFDLGFHPAEKITQDLSSKTYKGLSAVVMADDSTRAKVEEFYAKVTAPVRAEVGGSAEDSGANGQDTSDTREGSPNTDTASERIVLPATLGQRVATVEAIVAGIDPTVVGASEFVALAGVWAQLEALLDSVPEDIRAKAAKGLREVNGK